MKDFDIKKDVADHRVLNWKIIAEDRQKWNKLVKGVKDIQHLLKPNKTKTGCFIENGSPTDLRGFETPV